MPKAEQSLKEILYDLKRIEENREKLTEQKIRKIYKSLMKDLESALAEEFVKTADYTTFQKKSREARFLEEIVRRVDGISPDIKEEITDLVEETYKNCYTGMEKAVRSAADTKVLASVMSDTTLTPEVLKQAINNNISKLTLPHVLEKSRQQIIYEIKQTLTIGLINGDRYETIAKKISERVNVSYNKAVNITRTESHRNIESGMMDCAEEISHGLDGSGLVYTATWRSMGDERVRPNVRRKTKYGWKTYKSKNGANHQKMDGVTIRVGDRFKLESGVYAKCPGESGAARHDCNCRCFLEYDLMTEEEFAKLPNKQENDKKLFTNGKNGDIINNKDLSEYIGKDIVKTDNQSIREWYVANVSEIPNQIDKSKPFEEQVKQAYELRNKYKRKARVAMSDEEAVRVLEKKRPIKTFDELLQDKIERKNMTRAEALKDILKTASETNKDVNKEFGL